MEIIKLTLDNNTIHYYAQGDIMENNLQTYLKQLPLPPDMIYTDPPWTNGNCKYWRTIANKQDNNIKTYQISYKTFLQSLKKQLPSNTPLFIEGSKNTYKILENTFNNNYKYYKTFKVYYDDNKEQRLIIFNNKPIPLELDNTKDLEYVNASFNYIKPETVLDPCVGLGTTAKISYQHKNHFIGFDLNTTRIKKTIKQLNKHILKEDTLYG